MFPRPKIPPTIYKSLRTCIQASKKRGENALKKDILANPNVYIWRMKTSGKYFTTPDYDTGSGPMFDDYAGRLIYHVDAGVWVFHDALDGDWPG